jgi:hypothetical protein
VFTQQEEASHAPVAVLSDSLCAKHCNGDARVLGTTITLSRLNYTIIGVMPPGFEFPVAAGRLDQTLLWVPMSLTSDELSDANVAMWGYHLVARLKPGTTLPQAAQDANRVAQEVMRNFAPALSVSAAKFARWATSSRELPSPCCARSSWLFPSCCSSPASTSRCCCSCVRSAVAAPLP